MRRRQTSGSAAVGGYLGNIRAGESSEEGVLNMSVTSTLSAAEFDRVGISGRR